MEIADMYREYRYRRMFPAITDYWADDARKTDWFLHFERIDREVDAERETQQARRRGR